MTKKTKLFVRQSDRNENATTALQNLLTLLAVDVTKATILNIKRNNDYPSISSLSNSLKEWNIDNMVVQLTYEQLKEIPYPAIAHLNVDDGEFVVLKELSDDQITYIDSKKGVLQESIQNFNKTWSGVVLLAVPDKNPGEVNYEENYSKYRFTKFSSSVVWVVVTFIFCIPIPFLSISTLLFYLLSGVGAALCALLLQKQFGRGSAYINAFCKMGNKSDCDAVINSPASKVFGYIHLSEIGSWYFVGIILTIIVGSFLRTESNEALYVLSVSTIPFTIVAVYYQGIVIKKWCPLCLAVISVLWLEFITYLFVPISNELSWKTGTLIATVGFSIPLVFWLSIRQLFLDSFKIEPLEQRLSRFVRNENVFQKMLSDQPSVGQNLSMLELFSGSSESIINIMMVTNPTCSPCGNSHLILEKLTERYKEQLKVSYRFLINPSAKDSIQYKVAEHVWGVAMSRSNSEAINTLSDWYKNQHKNDLLKWKKANPLGESLNVTRVENVILEHANWCKQVHIQKTPTIFINGKELPTEFTINDLSFHIGKMLENINEPSTAS